MRRKPATLSRGILREPQQGEHVLDVRAIEELETTELDEGNIAARQLDFQMAAMAGRSKQNRLLFQDGAALAVFQHAVDDIAGLVSFIAHTHQHRPLGRLAFGPEILGETLRGKTNDTVRCGQDWLCRPVISVERDDVGGWTEAL